MLVAAVVNLQALQEGVLENATGRAVHGLWFRQWRSANPAVADRLHDERRAVPFTLSPLKGLPRPQQGHLAVAAASRAWFRATALEADLSARLEAEWLPRLPEEVTLGGLRWRVLGWTTDKQDHPWAGQANPQALAEERLLDPSPPRLWPLAFSTPTAFHGGGGHLPFPLPDALVGSWLRRWQAFGPLWLPDDLPERARRGLLVSGYALKTVPVRDRQRLIIGCVGRMTVRAVGLSAGERAAVDLLAAYAFWAGSGHHTTQGMGMTRLLPAPERRQR